jgi:predicted MFS family arabinose efflux permease
MGAIVYSLLLGMANEILFINYSPLMESAFGVNAPALVTGTIVISIAEVAGEFSVIGFADRFGKRRLALIGAVISAVMYIVQPHLAFSLELMLIGWFILYIAVEIAIVSSISLFTEILPDNRAVMMSSNVAAISLGRVSGAVVGGQLLLRTQNFTVVGGAAMFVGLLATFMLWRYVKEDQLTGETA